MVIDADEGEIVDIEHVISENEVYADVEATSLSNLLPLRPGANRFRYCGRRSHRLPGQ